MRFRLATTLLTIALIGVGLAWLVDRNSRAQISGTWSFPPPESSLSWTSTRYSDTLSITSDGKFSKTQDFGLTSETYSGNFHTDETGLTTFHVAEFVRDSKLGSSEKLDTDFRFLCRCTVDDFGYLVVNEYLEFREHQEFDERTANVIWRSYSRQ